MRKKLNDLERVSRLLDPGPDTRSTLFRQAGEYAEETLIALPDTATYRADEGREGFSASLITEEPEPITSVLEFFRREVDTTGILPACGG